MDNVTSNDICIAYLNTRLNQWNGSILSVEFLCMRCTSLILNLIVKDGLKDVDISVVKIHCAVRYVRSSSTRLQRFKACVQQSKIDCKGHVFLDVEIRWNSTFLMLESSLKFQKAFDLLYSQDSKYRGEMTKCDGSPSNEDWDCIRHMVTFLRIFYDATLRLSDSLYVTKNMYLQEILGIGVMISNKGDRASDPRLRKVALSMKKKQEKYLGNINNINLMLFIVVLLDPRRKWEYVNWVIHKSYEWDVANELCDKIKDTLLAMFESYARRHGSHNQPSGLVIEALSGKIPTPEVDDVEALMELEFQKYHGKGDD